MQKVVQENPAGVFTELARFAGIKAGGVTHPWQITDLWTDAELAAIGLYRVTITVPDGKLLDSYSFSRVNDVVQADLVLSDAPIASITRRQMLIGITQQGFITTAEAIAAAQSGAVPAAVQAVFDALPDQASKDAAAITWASMSECVRTDPLVAALAASQNLTTAQVDDMFKAWALI